VPTQYSANRALIGLCGVTKGQKRIERDTRWWSEDVQRAVKNKKESFKNWQKMRQDTSLKAVYNKACKETKSVVAKAKPEAAKHMHDELNTEEEQVKIYKIEKARQRSTQDKMAVNIIKDKDGTILTDEKLVQERWKFYFEELLNKENPRDPLEYVETVEGREDEISRMEIEKAIKQVRSNKAPGPSGITAEMIKALNELRVDWFHTILNEFLTDERVPGDLKKSEIMTIYKQKGDTLECGNYRGIKLL